MSWKLLQNKWHWIDIFQGMCSVPWWQTKKPYTGLDFIGGLQISCVSKWLIMTAKWQINKCLICRTLAYSSQLLKCVNYILLQHTVLPGNMWIRNSSMEISKSSLVWNAQLVHINQTTTRQRMAACCVDKRMAFLHQLCQKVPSISPTALVKDF